MELISSWGLCVLADAAGAPGDAAELGKAAEMFGRLELPLQTAQSERRAAAAP